MRDIGGLIWVIIVIIAIFSSIRKSVRQARQTMSQAQQRPAVPPRPAPPPQPPAAQPLTPLERALQLSPVVDVRAKPVAPAVIQVPAPAAPVPPTRMPPLVVTPPSVTPPHDPFRTESISRRRSSGLLGGMFEDKNAILRAVVGAEVLGKPKALQEQSIWSPPHSEP